MDTRVCSECGNEWPLDEHYFQKNKGDFLNKKCRMCRNKWDHMPDKPKEGFRVCYGCLKEYPENDKYFYKDKKRNLYNTKCKKCSNGKKTFDNIDRTKERKIYKENDKKFCYDCKRWKDLSFFRKEKLSIDGYTHQCFDCINEVKRVRLLNRREEFKTHTFDDKNLFKCVICGKSYPYTPDYFKKNYGNLSFLEKTCIVCYKAKAKEYTDANKERTKTRGYKYRKENREAILKKKREYYKKNKKKINKDKKEYYNSKIKFNSEIFLYTGHAILQDKSQYTLDS